MKAYALAAVVAAVAAGGCGGEQPTAAVQPPPQAPQAAPAEPAAIRSGTVSVPARVTAPAPAGRVVPMSRAKVVGPKLPRRMQARRARQAQLAVLRAHCATRPKNDPRCDGTRVNERVALETAR